MLKWGVVNINVLAFFKRHRKAVAGYLFVLPWIVGFILFSAYPIIYTFYLSFHEVSITTTGIVTQFIHWQNYTQVLFSDPTFMTGLVQFIQSVVLEIPIVIIFSLFVAILLNQKVKLKGFFRVIFFLPVVITSGVVVQQLFQQGAGTIPLVQKYGIVDMLKGDLGPGLSAPLISVISQLILVLWFSGVQILIFLAGLQKISNQVYEAASIDGASPWQTFWKITLPEVTPYILVNLIYTAVDLFTNSVNPVMGFIRDSMFGNGQGYGYASAEACLYSVLIFILLILIVLIFMWFGRRSLSLHKKKVAGTV